MAFLDEGKPRWEDCEAAGSGDTQITATTEEFLLVTGTKAPGDKYTKCELTNAADDVIFGVTRHVSPKMAYDPYIHKKIRMVSVKRGEKLRCRVKVAYTAANFGKKIVPSANSGEEGWGIIGDSGIGRVVDGETIDGKHYADFWYEESQ